MCQKISVSVRRLLPATVSLLLFLCSGCGQNTKADIQNSKGESLDQVLNTYFSSDIAKEYLSDSGVALGLGATEPSEEELEESRQVPDYIRDALEGYASESFMEQFFSTFPYDIISLCAENDYSADSHSASEKDSYEEFTCTLKNSKGDESFQLKGTVQYDDKDQVTYIRFDNLDDFPGL